MKSISLWQPWASAIVAGLKTIETRSWRTNYRGQLAIHAAKKRDGDPRDFWDSLDDGEIKAFEKDGIITFNDLPFGAVIATCYLVDCKRTEDLGLSIFDSESEWGNYQPGRFAWLLANIKPVGPFYCKGAQGLWEWETQ